MITGTGDHLRPEWPITITGMRKLMEQLDYNLLFRWFVGLSLDAVVWDVTVFTKNRERLIAATSPRSSSLRC